MSDVSANAQPGVEAGAPGAVRHAGAAGRPDLGGLAEDLADGIDAARLRVAVLRLARRLRKHELAGLTPSQLSTLSTVGKCGPVRLGDLAAAERIAPSTLTRLISVLEAKGYVRRDTAPGDARAFLVSITDEGYDVLRRIKDEATGLLNEILLTMPPEQVDALAAALPALEHLAGSG
jgi:DNA-binding MarR family transcriptional regulator